MSTILLIEDDAAFRRVYQDMLAAGCDVLVAEDGESGLQMALSHKPDLILLDLILPRLHGLDVLKKLRAEPSTKGIPVIILTALGEPDDLRMGLELGANSYLVKGFDSPQGVWGKIRTMLEQTKAKTKPDKAEPELPQAKSAEAAEPAKSIEEKSKPAPQKAQPASTAYRLAIKEKAADAPKVQEYVGLNLLLSCPQCNGGVLLELVPDETRSDGRWFQARFICPTCHTVF